MRERHTMAIEIGRRNIRVVQAVHAHGGLTIRRAMTVEIPSDVNASDPQALGEWLGQRLSDAGIPRGRAVAGLAREIVGVKRMNLPTVDDAELPDMTRLALQREGPLDASGMVIDFVAQEQMAAATTVLAVAAAHAVVEAAQQTLAAAGINAACVTLTTMGAAALVGKLNSGAGSALLIDVTGDSIEFAVVIDGSIRFSRAAELPGSADANAIADMAVTETRRTWTSYRTADDAADVAAVILLGDPEVGALSSAVIQGIVGAPLHALQRHTSIEAGEISMHRHWPLAGLLLESARGTPAIDLANPRRSPNLTLQRRKRRLFASAAALIVCGFIATLANLNLKSLRAQVARQASEKDDGVSAYNRYLRDAAKLEHLTQWNSAGIDWLRHADYLLKFSPPPDRVVFDSWTGSAEPVEVRFDPKKKKWLTPHMVTIVIDGEARDRETADAFREALVKNSAYTTSSPGADVKGGKRLPFGFTYRLRLAGELPSQPAPAAAADQNIPAPADARSSAQ